MKKALKDPASQQKPLPWKPKLAGWIGATLVRAFGLTFRYEAKNLESVLEELGDDPVIWAQWHNRIFCSTLIYKKFYPTRSGAGLTSASKDGDYLAAFIRAFGVGAVRGSSSRGGARALVQLNRWIQAGYDVMFTPDGPRGPRYQVAPGMVKLAEVTKVPVCPIKIEYSSYWELAKSWDKFRVPKPFSKITATFGPVIPVKEGDDLEPIQKAVEAALGGDK
ncbi:MAG: lysophospholipid acyltransferase family protein [Verrucomicrobiota bacterium]